MKFRFTIGRKILLGFGILIFLVLLAFSLTLLTIRKSREINDKIANLYNPSVADLQDMYGLILKSNVLINNWIASPASSEDKPRLKITIADDYPRLKKIIKTISVGWNDSDRVMADSIFYNCDALWLLDKRVMNDLADVSSYNDPSIYLPDQSMILDNDGEIRVATKNIQNN